MTQITEIRDTDIRYYGFHNEAGERFTLTHLPTGISIQSEWISHDQSLHKARQKAINELREKLDARI